MINITLNNETMQKSIKTYPVRAKRDHSFANRLLIEIFSYSAAFIIFAALFVYTAVMVASTPTSDPDLKFISTISLVLIALNIGTFKELQQKVKAYRRGF